MTGDATGATTGDIAGESTGEVMGDATGDAMGDATGDATGDAMGDVMCDAICDAQKTLPFFPCVCLQWLCHWSLKDACTIGRQRAHALLILKGHMRY